MMKVKNVKNIICLVIFLLFANQAWAASNPDNFETHCIIGINAKGDKISLKERNGRFWNLLSSDQKGIFISGMMEGVQAYFIASDVARTEKQSEYMKVRDTFFIEGFTTQEFANILDDIYKDKSNIRIPIFEVHRVAVKKSKGLSQKKIEDLLSDLRRKYIE
jgi:hypothetical protein